MKEQELDTNSQINKSESNRLPALDLARITAMLMMIQGHTLFEMTNPSYINVSHFPWNIWEFMRGLTAPVFLVVSGIVNVFANKRNDAGHLPSSTAKRRFRIALMLILVGYFMLFPADKIFHLAFIHPSAWIPFLQVNVLQLIGFSLLLVLLLFLITRNNRQLGIISLIMAMIITAINPFIHQINFFESLPEVFAAYLSMNHGSIFTIFPFTAYVLFGVAFGTYLRDVPQEKRLNVLFKSGIVLGIIFLIIGLPLYYYIDSFHFQYIDNLKANSGMMIIRLACVFFILSFITVIYKYTRRYSYYFSLFGKRALFIYIAHLIILYGLPWFSSISNIYHQKLTLWESILLALLVQILSLASAFYYEKSLKAYPTAKYFYRYAFLSIIIFLLLV